MEKILFLAHTDTNGNLPKIALETLNAALQITQGLAGSTLTVGLVGENVQAAADQIAACGATKILGVSGADFGMDVALCDGCQSCGSDRVRLGCDSHYCSRDFPFF